MVEKIGKNAAEKLAFRIKHNNLGDRTNSKKTEFSFSKLFCISLEIDFEKKIKRKQGSKVENCSRSFRK